MYSTCQILLRWTCTPKHFLEKRAIWFDKFENNYRVEKYGLLPPTSYRVTKIGSTIKSSWHWLTLLNMMDFFLDDSESTLPSFLALPSLSPFSAEARSSIFVALSAGYELIPLTFTFLVINLFSEYTEYLSEVPWCFTDISNLTLQPRTLNSTLRSPNIFLPSICHFNKWHHYLLIWKSL